MAQPAGTSPATAQIPHLPEERLSIQPSDTTCSNVRVQYGFMEDPNVPEALEQACEQVAPASCRRVTYFLRRETIIVTRREGMAIWREKLFVLMAQCGSRHGFLPATT